MDLTTLLTLEAAHLLEQFQPDLWLVLSLAERGKTPKPGLAVQVSSVSARRRGWGAGGYEAPWVQGEQGAACLSLHHHPRHGCTQGPGHSLAAAV